MLGSYLHAKTGASTLGPTGLTAGQALRFAAARETQATKGIRALEAVYGMCKALLESSWREARSASESHGHGLREPGHRLSRANRFSAHAPADDSYVCSQHGQAGAYHLASGLRAAHEGGTSQASAGYAVHHAGPARELPRGRLLAARPHPSIGCSFRAQATQEGGACCVRAGRGSAPAAIAENCPSIAARFAPSPPPSSPASPDCPAAQLHADDEELAGVEGHHQPAIIEVERRPTRIGVRLASVRSLLSFGMAPVVASKGQHITSPKSPSRKSRARRSALNLI